MGEEKEKIQQAVNGLGKEIEQQTAESQVKEKNKKKRLLYALAFSVLVALFFMSLATAVNCEFFSYLFNAISSAGYISAAVCLTWLIWLGGIKNIGWKKRIAKAIATAIFFFGAVLLSVATWGSVLNQNFEDVLFWLVAISWALVSALIIVKQISLEKQDFEEKPVMSYLFILCGMIYAFAYAVILKFNFDLALKIFYTIHTVVALTVFINIIFKFGIKTNNFAQLALFIVSIITLMALLVSTLYFWFWDSYDTEIFTSIMGVFAGLLGGVLTLTGVAWTIKRQDEIRKEDEKKKIKPYVILVTEELNFANIKYISVINNNGIGKIGSKNTYLLDENFQIKNVGKAACFLDYIKINGEKQIMSRTSLVENEKALISVGYQYKFITLTEEKIESIKLGIYDLDFNLYEFDVKFKIKYYHTTLNDISEKERDRYISNDDNSIVFPIIIIEYIDCSGESIKVETR